MPCESKTVFLFTAQFPYGNKSETFLETEVEFLSQKFTKIFIFPSAKLPTQRPIPENCFVDDALNTINLSQGEKYAMLVKHWLITQKLLLSEISDKGLMIVLKNLRTYLDIISRELFKFNTLKNKVFDKNETVFYDYWFQNSTLALSLLKYKGYIYSFVSRGHGYDIYDERMPSTGIRFRKWIIKQVDKVFIISNFGANYFRSKISKEFQEKIIVSRLGVYDPMLENVAIDNEVITVVSCSSLLPFKRVEKIPMLLSNFSCKIHWIHFGDGITKEEVLKNCLKLPENVTFELKGHVDNKEILTFYKLNTVELLISLSTSEGLPVSMMEAISYGIPVFAVNVGGVSEIVIDNKTGKLVPEEYDDSKLFKALQSTILTKFDRKEIRRFFEENYNAGNNYESFIEQIC